MQGVWVVGGVGRMYNMESSVPVCSVVVIILQF